MMVIVTILMIFILSAISTERWHKSCSKELRLPVLKYLTHAPQILHHYEVNYDVVADVMFPPTLISDYGLGTTEGMPYSC